MTTVPGLRTTWNTARGPLALDRPRIVGVLNVTPDSFWDGGRHAGIDRAVAWGARLIEDGADILDVGGESTRPGATPVPPSAELGRIVPVILELAASFPDVPISVDTVKAGVARAALDAGAAIVNDVSGLRLDPAIASMTAAAGAGLVLMHSRGGVDRMASYDLAEYERDPVSQILEELGRSVEIARARGVPEDTIAIDPGLGFAKRTEHTVAALVGLPRLGSMGFPILVGPSRKRFISDLQGGGPVEERLEGTLAACVFALLSGARLFRVHDVAAARRALDVAEALRVAS